MRRNYFILLIISAVIASCNNDKRMKSDNPFFEPFGTPYEVPAFEKISNDDFLPAFKEGIRLHEEQVDAIAGNTEPPTFSNTVEALDQSGDLLVTVSNVFYNLTSANTNDTLQEIARQVSPLLTSHYDNILLNSDLFLRVKAVYGQKDQLDLDPEQAMLLEKTYKRFTRGGANLSVEDQGKLREVNKQLSLLSLKFGDNLLAETNDFRMVLEDSSDLAGLPPFVIEAAAEAAREKGMDGKWVFTTHKPSLIPFLQYSSRRDLRETMLKAYIMRGDNNNENDNKATLAKIAALRVQKANLLGYPTHAAYILEENMAKNPETVYQFMDKIWGAALPVAKKEAAELQAMIDGEGGGFKLEPWDWWYYAEKLRKDKYDLDEETLKPYFSLNNVISGMFMVANRLYGIKFSERVDIPKYHPDVVTYEVLESDGSHVGILLMDFFPRASKEGGAWMNSYRDQYRVGEKKVTPIVTMVCNFTKPTPDTPSLLTFEEASTLFHEFGHALHGLLSDVTYRRLSGTSVSRDFVEIASQIMENWCAEPEVLKKYARHYKTHKAIPDDLVDKMNKSRHFNQGFATVEVLSAAYLDMDWHTLTDTTVKDANAFEQASLERIGLIPEIIVRYRSPYFSHIFSGGYSSGYYSYYWAEVLDADAYEAFREKGIFDEETARLFRENILSKGGTAEPMELYVRFRGKEPSVEPMLRRKGLLEE